MKSIKSSTIIVIAICVLAISCGQNPESTNKTSGKDTSGSVSTPADASLKPTDTGYAGVNGLNMYYEVYGQGKPIVLLHGSFMNIPMNWAQIIPVLSKTRKVIVAEMQAHGRTKDIPRAITYEGMADDVSDLLKHLRIDSADVLGYSMGGGVAFQFAVRHPGQLRRLVILSGSYANNGWWPDVEASFASINADVFKGSPIEQEYLRMGNDPKAFPDFIKKVLSPDRTAYDWSKQVKQINSPIFFAIGDADGLKYQHAIDLFVAKGGGKMGDMHGLPKSRLAILPGTTHIGMMKKSELWIPMVVDFLDSDLSTVPPAF